jgi:hypothetical protein
MVSLEGGGLAGFGIKSGYTRIFILNDRHVFNYYKILVSLILIYVERQKGFTGFGIAFFYPLPFLAYLPLSAAVAKPTYKVSCRISSAYRC